MFEKRGPHGPFLGCSQFPHCKATRNVDTQSTPPLPVSPARPEIFVKVELATPSIPPPPPPPVPAPPMLPMNEIVIRDDPKQFAVKHIIKVLAIVMTALTSISGLVAVVNWIRGTSSVEPSVPAPPAVVSRPPEPQAEVPKPKGPITVEEKRAYRSALKVSDYPVCPKCGKKMVIRVRKDNSDDAFFGCSDFPNCRGTKNIDYPR